MKLFAVVLLLTAPLGGQTGSPVKTLTSLPPKTLLPISLDHAIRAGKTPAGTKIEAETTQRVPVGKELYLPPGVRITGTVLASTARPALLALRFDTLEVGGQSIPILTKALAIANFVQAEETHNLCSGPADLVNPDPADWTTCQVGGDEVVRSGWVGPVVNSVIQTVGFADFNGVYRSSAVPGDLPKALGVFSSASQGLYGFDEDARLLSTGGTITLTAPRKLLVRRNDNLLLQVD